MYWSNIAHISASDRPAICSEVSGRQPTLLPGPTSFPLRVEDRAQNLVINSSSFIKHLDIKVLRTIEVSNIRTDDDDIMRPYLTDTI
jgi:hypothetical protein